MHTTAKKDLLEYILKTFVKHNPVIQKMTMSIIHVDRTLINALNCLPVMSNACVISCPITAPIAPKFNALQKMNL